MLYNWYIVTWIYHKIHLGWLDGIDLRLGNVFLFKISSSILPGASLSFIKNEGIIREMDLDPLIYVDEIEKKDLKQI